MGSNNVIAINTKHFLNYRSTNDRTTVPKMNVSLNVSEIPSNANILWI